MAKYDDDFKSFAVEYYLETGSIRSCAKDLGVARNTLVRWLRESRAPVKPSTPAAVPRTSYPEATKRLALGLYCGRHWTLSEASMALGMPVTAMSAWKTRHVDTGLVEVPVLKDDEIPGKALAMESSRSMGRADLLRTLRALELRNAILEESPQCLKAEGVDDLTNAEKAQVVNALSGKWTVTDITREIGLPQSTYYYIRAAARRNDKYAAVRVAICGIFEESRRRYGYRRVWSGLRKQGVIVSEKVVRRLMAEEGCVVAGKRRGKRRSSCCGEISEAPPNLLNRDFKADAPNTKWLTDITEMKAADGKVYLSPVIDCFDGMVVAHTAGRHPSAELANTMLRKACAKLRPGESPMIYNDRGGHYRREGWMRICVEEGLVRSMSKKGCSPDNAAC